MPNYDDLFTDQPVQQENAPFHEIIGPLWSVVGVNKFLWGTRPWWSVPQIGNWILYMAGLGQ